jgi:hypothetical protein
VSINRWEAVGLTPFTEGRKTMNARTTTSATIASSIALRVRALAIRIHDLGPRPLFELMCELAGGADPFDRFEAYGALDPHTVRVLGGADLTPHLYRVK